MPKKNLKVRANKLVKADSDYEKDFYLRCAEKGIDYNYYGEWQRQYVKLVIYVTDFLRRIDRKNRTLLDVGAACGVNIRAFKELQIFNRLVGIDVSNYMVQIGRETHKLDEYELVVAPCTDIPIEDESVDLLHCSQLFEHLDANDINDTIMEFKRVLKDDGIGFITLAAAKEGVSIEHVKKVDESHITAEHEKWWHQMFGGVFHVDKEANARFKKARFSPSQNEETFYTHYKLEWTIFVISKSNFT